MLQAFHEDDAKVDQGVIHVVIVIHICCNLLSSMFHCLFQRYDASLFILMLHMFHTYVVYVLQ
jgi:hypothetical protein